MIGENANHNSLIFSFRLNCFVILNSTIFFDIPNIFASHSPFLLKRENIRDYVMNKLRNNPMARALLQTARRRQQMIPNKKRPKRNNLKDDLRRQWEEI